MYMEQFLKENTLILKRALIEVRYERSFLFEEVQVLNKISKGLRADFPQPQRDQNSGGLVLANPKNKGFLAIHADSSVVNFDEVPAFSTFKNHSIRGIEAVSTNLEVDYFNRVGIRMFFGKNFETLKEAESIVKDKFFNSFDSVAKELANPNLSFTFNENGFGINITLRAETNIDVDVNNGLATQTQYNLIVFDIDVYSQETTTPKQLNGIMNGAKEIALRKLELLNKIISG